MNKLIILLIIIFSFSGFSQEKNRPKIGLTLSGGGAKGLAHIGVIRVMEEAGIRPDYITGTSMGSIIGGLYAIGYSPDELEEFVHNTDWDKLMKDYISRKDMAMTEKEFYEKYILDIPIKKKKKETLKILAQAMHSGFNITMEFIKLTERVEEINDFSKFEIPFEAIATDIEHGKSVILKSGNLALAMRASMAIPSVFSPVLINDTLLVDGGLINNFPVKELKDMGADIVIGVDVQSPFYTQDELNSVINIFQQASKILRKPNNELGISLTDIYIKPDVTKYSVLGFGDADTIIKLGEAAGRQMLPEFKKLANKYNLHYKRDTTNKNYKTVKVYKLSEIHIDGLKNVKRKHVLGRLKLDTTSFIIQKNIEDAVVRLRGSDYFSSIYYNTVFEKGKTILNLYVVEKTNRQFKVGANYNTISQASVLLTYINKNLLLKSSRLQLTAKVGKEPYLFANYLIDNGWKPGLGFTVFGLVKNILMYNGRENSAIATYNINNLSVKLYTQSTLYNSIIIGGGGEYEGTTITEDIAIKFGDYKKNYFNIFGFLNVDYLDKLYFPNSGFLVNAEFKTIFEAYYDPRVYLSFRYKQVIPIVKKLNLLPKIYAGTNIGDDIPIEYLFTTNEFIEYPIKSYVPFIGLKYNQRYAQTILIGRLDLQYQIFKNNYLTFIANIGSFADTYEDVIKNDNKEYISTGFGMSYSIQTLIGPISLGFSESDYTHTVFTYFAIGFQF